MMHSWHKDYDKECVPAWDYYPVLEAVKARHELLYPSARLDQLHSEKRYRSLLMPPTEFIHLVRSSGRDLGWQVEDHSCQDQDLEQATANAIARLSKQAAVAGLPLKDIMVKQGLSWGGDDVARVAPVMVQKHLKQKVLPKVPCQAKKLTVLLQAKVDLVAELRWVILNGKLRGRGWRTFQQAPRGRSIKAGGMRGEIETREALIAAGLAQDMEGIVELEESLRDKVELVLQEATADAGGEVPQYLRVDLLIDKQGRAWLGERESWGADLQKNTLNRNTGAFTRQDPSKSEVATAIVTRAVQSLCRKHAAPSSKKYTLARKAHRQRRSFASPFGSVTVCRKAKSLCRSKALMERACPRKRKASASVICKRTRRVEAKCQ
jgi:hypothetical protein